MNIRVSAKAIIIQDDKLLAIQKQDPAGDYYILPGGGQNPGETLHQALQRECMEEASLAVAPGELRFVREYIGQHHEFSAWDSNLHQLELMFTCQIPVGAHPRQGSLPDVDQTGVAWLPLERLDEFRLYPLTLILHLMRPGEEKPIYLGDVN
jgi:8-oxo-dGTP pyrophosphatase MutT (NUDIX family)